MKKCKKCGSIIMQKIVLCCTCGAFCDVICMEHYHKDKLPKVIIEFDCSGWLKRLK